MNESRTLVTSISRITTSANTLPMSCEQLTQTLKCGTANWSIKKQALNTNIHLSYLESFDINALTRLALCALNLKSNYSLAPWYVQPSKMHTFPDD